MFRKRYRQQIPELNTTSTADISFMLLIFFLVTSSMDTDKGLMRQMAPPPIENQPPTDISRDLVMQVVLDERDCLTLNGREVTFRELTDEVRAMASVNRTDHVIALQVDRSTSYEAYFRMQDAIVSAYHSLREVYARQHYGHAYADCNSEERSAINDYYPQRISESSPTSQKGGGR